MLTSSCKRLSGFSQTSHKVASPQPFGSADEAWFWALAALQARREGAHRSSSSGRVERPCDPDDVVKCLDQLYRRRRIDLVHARVLRIWGERGVSPAAYAASPSDIRLWREAMSRLEFVFRVKGIVA